MKFIPINQKFFECIDSVLYVFDKAIEESGLSVGYYHKLKSQNHQRVKFLDHPQDKRYNLTAFETLTDAAKEKIIARFGNPYNFIIKEPILNLLSRNSSAEKYFLAYRYADQKALPLKRVKQYTRACEWIDALVKIEESRNKIIKEMNISVPEFYKQLEEILISEKTNGASETFIGSNQLHSKFPTSYRFLRPKIKEYKDKGFSIFIDKMFGNQLASKTTDDEQKDFLIELISKPEQYNDVLVCMLYLEKAKQNGWPEITPGTVRNFRIENAAEIYQSRYGREAFNERFIPEIPRARPSAPFVLFEHDDYNHNYLFQDADKYQYNRYVSIIVTDSFNDLVIGKSTILGHTPEPWQVEHAYIDAMYYIRKHTGAWYMPFEFKADRYKASYNQKINKNGEKRVDTLDPFYDKLKQFAKTAPPALGNKHGRYIERFFGSPFLKNCEKLLSQGNYNGNNMTAKNRGFNPDMLERSLKEKSRPFVGTEAETQIEKFFYMLRHMPAFTREQMNAPSKHQQWLQAFNQLTDEQKNPITDEQFLLTFGITHQPKHTDHITITNRGITPQIQNTEYIFKLPQLWMHQKLNGAKVQIIYDPFDMNRVLVTNHDDIRFIAHSAQLVPSALKDAYTGSRTYLDALLSEKKEFVQVLANTSAKRKVLNENNAQAVLQSGAILPKAMKNKLEQKQLEQDNSFTQQHEDWMNDENNFSEFFNQ